MTMSSSVSLEESGSDTSEQHAMVDFIKFNQEKIKLFQLFQQTRIIHQGYCVLQPSEMPE